MPENILQILFFSETIIFLSIIFLQIIKESKSIVRVYVFQSIAVSVMLFALSYTEHSFSLFFSAFLSLIVKAYLAPKFFYRLIDNQKINISASAYLSTPLTLLITMIIVLLANSAVFRPLVALTQETQQVIAIALGGILSSLFLTINRRGALSQIIGILSLENAIVSFGSLIGIKQELGLELGVIFDISVWMIIAAVFTTIVYRHFGTLNITEIKHLKD